MQLHKLHAPNNLNFFIIHSIIPIFIGGFLYLIFRSQSLRMFQWVDYFGWTKFITNLRTETLPIKKNLPFWVYDSLPNALWVYSFSSALILLYGKNIKGVNYWLLIPFVYGVGAEL